MRTGYCFIPCTQQMLKSGLLDRTSSMPSLNVSIKVFFLHVTAHRLSLILFVSEQ